MVIGLIRYFCVLVTCWMSMSVWAVVEVNSASKVELEGVKGIGPSTSSKILDERQRGAFAGWDDVIGRVQGLGPKTANKLSSAGLRVNGAAYLASDKPLTGGSTKSAQGSRVSSLSGGDARPAAASPGNGDFIRWSEPRRRPAAVAGPGESRAPQAMRVGAGAAPAPAPAAVRPLRAEGPPLKLRPAP